MLDSVLVFVVKIVKVDVLPPVQILAHGLALLFVQVVVVVGVEQLQE